MLQGYVGVLLGCCSLAGTGLGKLQDVQVELRAPRKVGVISAFRSVEIRKFLVEEGRKITDQVTVCSCICVFVFGKDRCGIKRTLFF